MTFSTGNPTDTLAATPNPVNDDPSWVPDRWRSELWPLWVKVKDVYDGLHLRKTKRRYLQQAEGESPFEYEVRLSGSYLDEHYRVTLEKNAGLIAQFDVDPESPEDLKDEDFTKNIDNEGNSLKAFAQKSLARIFRDEFCLLGVSIPQAFSEDDMRQERKAFFTLTDCRDVRAPLVQHVDDNGLPSLGGKLALTRVSIRRWVQVPSGNFSYVWRQQFWVYRLIDGICTVQVYEAAPSSAIEDTEDFSGDRDETLGVSAPMPITEQIIVRDAAGRALKQLPFYWFHLDKDANIGEPGTPPLLYLAETLLTWFNKESQLDAAERRCNLPTPVMAHPGGVPENPPDVRIGPGGVIHIGGGGSFDFAEPSGSALGSTHNRQIHREERMQRIDERFVGASSGEGLTATAVKLADRVSKITLDVISETMETAFAEIFKLYSLFTDPNYEPGDSAGGIEVSRSILEGDLQATELAVLLSMLQEGAIDRFEFRAMTKLQSLQLNDDVMRLAERFREEFESEMQNGIAFNPGDPALFQTSSDLTADTSGIPGQSSPGSQQASLQQINGSTADVV